MATDSLDGFVSRWRNSLFGSAPDLAAEATSSPVGETDPVANGLVEHLGSELPEGVGFSSDEESIHQKNGRTIQTKHHDPNPTARKMNSTSQKQGKLKRVSRGGVNSPSQIPSDHSPEKAFVQKRMRLPPAARRSVYDIDESPQKLPPKKPLDTPRKISPLRQQRRPQNTAASQLQQIESTADDTTSDRLQVPDITTTEQNESPNVRRSPRNKSTVAASSSKEPSGLEQEASDQDDAYDSSDNLFVGQQGDQGPTPEPALQVTPAKRKRGRPSKVQRGGRSSQQGRIAESDHPNSSNDTHSHVPPSAQRRGRGRPRRKQESDRMMPGSESDTRHEYNVHAPPNTTTTLVRNMILKVPWRQRLPKENAGDAPNKNLRIVNARKSSVKFSNDTGETERGEDEESVESVNEVVQQRPRQKQPKKGQGTQISQAAGPSSKRQKITRLELVLQSQRTQNEVDAEAKVSRQSSSSKDVHSERLLGQWPALRRALHGLSKIGVSKIDGVEQDPCVVGLDDEDVAGIVQLTRLAKEKFSHLKDHPEDTENPSDPPEEIPQIYLWLDVLCGKNARLLPDFKDQDKIANIYFHLFAYLVRLLLHMIKCYEAMDVDEAPPGVSLSTTHLDTVTKFIWRIFEMGKGAKKYRRPDSSLAIVQPVEHKVLLPLRDMYTVFKRYLSEHASRQAQRELEAEEARRLAIEEAQKDEERKQNKKYEALRRKWGNLHAERQEAERGIMPLQKQRHLFYRESEPEEDHNGDLFERVQVFRPRIGPTPSMIAKVKAQGMWPKTSTRALVEGLQMWSGDEMVFEKIFRAYCGRHGPLNGYNVTEIVVTAALLKEHLHGVQQASQGWVEKWVTMIPNWTETLTLLTEESVELEVEDEGDEDVDGDEDVNGLYE